MLFQLRKMKTEVRSKMKMGGAFKNKKGAFKNKKGAFKNENESMFQIKVE